MFGFGLRYKLERVETALRAALAERDDYLRQLIVALGERDELRRQRDHFRGELDRLQRRPDDQEALSRLDAGEPRAPRRRLAIARLPLGAVRLRGDCCSPGPPRRCSPPLSHFGCGIGLLALGLPSKAAARVLLHEARAGTDFNRAISYQKSGVA